MDDLWRFPLLTASEAEQDEQIVHLNDPLRILARIIARDLSKREAPNPGKDLTNKPILALLESDKNER